MQYRQLIWKSQLKWLFIFVAVTLSVLSSADTQAYTVLTRVWPTANTTYTKDTDFVNMGTGWVAAADAAAASWNATGAFTFSANTSSINHLQAHSLGAGSCSKVANTHRSNIVGQTYTEYFIIEVNTGSPCNFNFYTGTGTPMSNQYDLRSVLRHEFGHALGLNHTAATGKLMTAGNLGVGTGVIRLVDADASNGAKYLYDPSYAGVFPEGPAEPGYVVGAGAWDGMAQGNTSPYPFLVGYKGANWTPGTAQPRAFNTTLSWSNSNHSSAWITFSGSRITRLYTKHYLRGTTEVFIDGALQTTTNDYSALTRWQVAKTWSVAAGQHTIEVRRASSSGGYSDLDAFLVDIPANGAGSFDDAVPGYNYIGAWTHSTCCSTAYNGTISWSSTTADAVNFTFSGTSLTYVYTKAYNRGVAYITIDGLDYTDIDLYAPLPNAWQASTVYNLSPGVHTIHIAVSGVKNPASANYYVDVDRMIVQ